MKKALLAIIGLVLALLLPWSGVGQDAKQPSASNTTPDKVETSIGTLEYKDGAPSKETVAKVYDYLDLMHGVEAFVNAYQGASVASIFKGCAEAGIPNNTAMIFSELMDAKSLFLTGNADTVYFFVNLDASKGPIVVETPPLALGVIDDMWFHWVTDFGLPGPDRGEGGKYLLVPPDYKGELPGGGYYVQKLRTDSRHPARAVFSREERPEAGRRADQEDAQCLSLPSRWIRHEHRLCIGWQGDAGAHAGSQARLGVPPPEGAHEVHRRHGQGHEHGPAE